MERYKGKDGVRLQLNFCLLDLGNFDFCAISSIVLAPFFESVMDHSQLMFHRSDLGHLHHMHEYCEVAESRPHTIAKNFQSQDIVQCRI